jgi:hypothetical protein
VLDAVTPKLERQIQIVAMFCTFAVCMEGYGWWRPHVRSSWRCKAKGYECIEACQGEEWYRVSAVE